ncbi:MAG: DNA primase [Patescibacteria group bacterium]|jgi:DNA primase
MKDTERIKERVDLVDLISEYVRLTPAGINFKARCPFHKEKTPSFMVNRDRQYWHCFGCSRSGDVFAFVMEVEGIEFPEALRLLAKRAGVELSNEGKSESNERTRLLDVHKWATAYFMKQLTGERGADARKYLEERGMDTDVQEQFGIGFAPEAWEHAMIFLKEKQFTEKEIFQAGLTVKSEKRDGYYERFRNRIMFPIADVHGNVIGFGGRTLDKDDPAKYLNSPQTPIYDKSRVLYGLYRAKKAIRDVKAVVLVEGYTDVIASHRVGVQQVVGVSGTALTKDQLGLLKRFTNTIIVAFDADMAGEAATARGLDLALEMEMEIKALLLPKGKDPDELVRENAAAWKQCVENARPFFAVLFDQLVQRHGTETVEAKKQITKQYLTALAKIADPVEQRHYLEQLAHIVHVDVETLMARLPARLATKRAGKNDLSKAQVPPTHVLSQQHNSPPEKQAQHRASELLEELLALLLHKPTDTKDVADVIKPEQLPEGDLRKLYTLLISLYTHEAFSTDLLTQKWEEQGGQRSLIEQLVLRFDRDFSEFPSRELDPAAITHARELTKLFLIEGLRRIEREMKSLETAGGDESGIEQLTEQFQNLSQQLRALR